LPMYYDLSEEDQMRVVEEVRSYLGSRGVRAGGPLALQAEAAS
jgi:hypothetical protein